MTTCDKETAFLREIDGEKYFDVSAAMAASPRRPEDDREFFPDPDGFAGYYIHPAAPPWYAINYGFEPILDTPGNVAGLGRFDALTGLSIFDSIYGRNANVFAAVPSLHAAYMVVALCYAIINKCNKFVIVLFTIIMVGIWGTAVYTSHHYIIDVTLGICCALLGILLFEKGLMKTGWFKNFFNRYYNYIK